MDMKKEFKDYLHLYPNVSVQFNNEKYKVSNYGAFEKAFITGLFQNEAGAGLMAQLCVDDWETPLEVMVEEFKLILRPLESMTEQECVDIARLAYGEEGKDMPYECVYGELGEGENRKVVQFSEGNYIVIHLNTFSIENTDDISKDIGSCLYDVHNIPEIIRYLLSKHFDLFGLIESGIALNATATQK